MTQEFGRIGGYRRQYGVNSIVYVNCPAAFPQMMILAVLRLSIGFCLLCVSILAVPPLLLPSSISAPSFNHTNDVTDSGFTFNATIPSVLGSVPFHRERPMLTSITAPFLTPFIYHEPSSPQSIRFYSYGPRISRIDAFNCIKAANQDSWQHAGNEPMAIRPKGRMYVKCQSLVSSLIALLGVVRGIQGPWFERVERADTDDSKV